MRVSWREVRECPPPEGHGRTVPGIEESEGKVPDQEKTDLFKKNMLNLMKS